MLSHPQKSPGRHLDGHWHKGHGGLRSEGEDLSDEEQRLHELEVGGPCCPGLVLQLEPLVVFIVHVHLLPLTLPGRAEGQRFDSFAFSLQGCQITGA